MRGNGARHRWLLSRFGNCPRDRRSITIIYTTIRPITLLKLVSRQLRSVTIPLEAYDEAREIPSTSCKSWKCHFCVSYIAPVT